jgi:hypothetical protein
LLNDVLIGAELGIVELAMDTGAELVLVMVVLDPPELSVLLLVAYCDAELFDAAPADADADAEPNDEEYGCV